jgi:Mn2+/Fe2+ NRAMP family transporter
MGGYVQVVALVLSGRRSRNGLLAPFLLSGILVVASDSKLMQGQPNSPLGRVVVLVVTIAMFIAALAMFVL